MALMHIKPHRKISLCVLNGFSPCMRAKLVNTKLLRNVGTILVYRLRRWANIESTFVQCLMFA